MFDFLKKRREERPLPCKTHCEKGRVLLLIDFDNIRINLADDVLAMDLVGIMNEAKEYGVVVSATMFVPMTSVYHLPKNTNKLGFSIDLCQVYKHGEKREDKVDAIITERVASFLCLNFTHVILATHDVHSLETARMIIKSGRQLIYMADETKMGKELRDFISDYCIPVVYIPVQPLELTR